MNRKRLGRDARRWILTALFLGSAVLLLGCRKQEAVFVAGETVVEEQEAIVGTMEETGREPEPAEELLEEERESETHSQTMPDSRKSLKVYVCGEVSFPGVYELKEGDRVADAIDLAGGMTGEAAIDVLNLAAFVIEAQMIRVPSIDEVHNDPQRYAVSANAAQESNDGAGNLGKISLNQATKEQLMTLPGIGEAKADAILAYRTEAGGFDKIEDLMNVPGIKEGTFLKMKDKITE